MQFTEDLFVKSPNAQNQLLVTDSKYEGKYVALGALLNGDVLAAGDDPEDVLAQARAKGAKDPVIVFIPETGVTGMY